MGLSQRIYAISESGNKEQLMYDRNNYKLHSLIGKYTHDVENEITLEDLNNLKDNYYNEADEYEMFEDYKNESVMYAIIKGKRFLEKGYKLFYSS